MCHLYVRVPRHADPALSSPVSVQRLRRQSALPGQQLSDLSRQVLRAAASACDASQGDQWRQWTNCGHHQTGGKTASCHLVHHSELFLAFLVNVVSNDLAPSALTLWIWWQEGYII